MKQSKIKISILPNQFLQSNGKFDKEEALKLAGKIAGICYDKEGFSHLENEAEEKTKRRIDMTLNNGHHSVYDHICINLNLQNIPKILAMVLNNEHQYTTSEKSARYTPVRRQEGSVISELEENLYEKWMIIFQGKIKELYGNVYNDAKIKKLAQENARYLTTIFMPTQMIYTTSLRQINYITSWMMDYINNIDKTNGFERRLALSMQEFISELEDKNILEPGLLKNEKNRKLSLFGNALVKKEEIFNDIYATNYKTSLATLAQLQRHRTIDYQMEFLDEKEFFIPPIIADNQDLTSEWLHDMFMVKEFTPQGELVQVRELGKYEDFILKCKERLCTEVQLENMLITRDILQRYKEELERNGGPLSKDIENYTHGARCTFKAFLCSSDCNFIEGKRLIRKI